MTTDTGLPELEAMRLGVDYRQQLRLRGFSYSVRPLSIAEVTAVTNRVADFMDRLPPASRTAVQEHLFYARETLKTAGTPEPFSTVEPRVTDYLLDRMTPEELEHLFSQYVAMTDRVNPSLETMTAEQLKLLESELLKKKAESLRSELIELSSSQQLNLLQYLLTRSDSPPDKWSGGAAIS